MMGEDFAFMLRRRPGCYALLGTRGPDGRGAVPPHNPGYDFNDDLLPIGASYFAALVKQELPLDAGGQPAASARAGTERP